MADLVVPQLGESISEAVISKWLKNVGDAVTVDEPIAELETDKITVQLPSPVAGALSEQRFAVGATVKVGDVIGAVDAGKQGKAVAPPAKATPPPREVVTAQPRAAAGRRATRHADRLAGPAADRRRSRRACNRTCQDERPRRSDGSRSTVEAHAVATRDRARDRDVAAR